MQSLFKKNNLTMTQEMFEALLRRFNKNNNQVISKDEFFNAEFIMPNSGNVFEN